MRAATRAAPDRSALDLEGLDGQIGYLLRRAQLAVFADFAAALQELRLRPGLFAVLRTLGNNPGVSQNEVCAALGIQRANLVTVLDELETRGLAARHASDVDRRSNALHLTAQGQKLLRRANELQTRHEQRVVERLGVRGRDELLRLLARLANTTTT